MSIVSVKEIWPGREGEDTVDRQRTYPRFYEVISDDIGEKVTTVGAASGIPRLGDAHPDDSFAFVVRVRAKQNDDNPYQWLVEVSYDTELRVPEIHTLDPETGNTSPLPTPSQRSDTPLMRPAVWKFGSMDYHAIAKIARHGVSIWTAGVELYNSNPVAGRRPAKMKPEADGSILITNSAGDPFDPPIEVEEARGTIDITWNVLAFNAKGLSQLTNCVNRVAWYGYPARTLRVKVNEAQQRHENGFAFWERHVQLVEKEETWDLDPLDRGTRELIAEGETSEGLPENNTPDEYGNFLNPDGTPAVELLDGNGRRLPPGKPPVYLYYRYFREKDFAGEVFIGLR